MEEKTGLFVGLIAIILAGIIACFICSFVYGGSIIG